MSFFSVVKVEFVKLLRKRISFLLLLFFAPAILFGVGMSLGLSFFVADGGGGGVDAVAKSLSGIGFAVNMMEQSKYIVFLVIIILAAFSLSSELENGQIKSELIRVCSRSKIVSAKYLALFLLITGTFLLSLLWQLLIYAVLVSKTEFASGMLFDELLWAQIGYIGFTLLGIGNGLAVTFLRFPILYGLQAYTRILWEKSNFSYPIICRVISWKRREEQQTVSHMQGCIWVIAWYFLSFPLFFYGQAT